MSSLPHALTLGNSWGEVAFFALFLILAFGGQVIKALREAKGEQGGNDNATEAARAARQARLDALAKRRGQQARDAGLPDNLTVEQGEMRQQAKTIYERRAEALRHAKQRDADPDQPGWQADPDQVKREQTRRTRDRAEEQRAEAQRRAEAQQQARLQAERRKREKAELKKQAAESKRRERLDLIAEREKQLADVAEKLQREREKLLGSGVSRSRRVQDEEIGSAAIGIDHSQDAPGVTHRRVTDAESSAYEIKSGVQHRFRGALTGQSLRNALVLREVLGPPRALLPHNDIAADR